MILLDIFTVIHRNDLLLKNVVLGSFLHVL